MATNYLQKNRNSGGPPSNYLTRNSGDGSREDQRRALAPVDTENTDDPPASGGFVPVNTAKPNAAPVTPAAQSAAAPGVPTFSNDPTIVDKTADIINSPFANLPSYQRALELRNQRIALEMQPSYVNDKGETVQGLQDKDGRIQSGLKALVANLAENFDPRRGIVRDWGQLAAGAAGAAGAGVSGAIFPEWNEWDERKREVARLKAAEDDAMKRGEFESKMLTQATNRQNVADDNTRADVKMKTAEFEKKRADLIRQYNHLTVFDPDNADNADFVSAAQELGVPVPRKNGASSIKYLTDAKTGQVYADIFDKAGNRQLTQLTNNDGTDFKMTTPQMMTAEEKDEDRKLRERIAKEGNITRLSVAEIGARSRKEVATTNQAGTTGRANQTQAAHAAQVIAAIKQAAPAGSKPEQIQQKIDQYLQSLPAEVRKLINQ